jgi:hypothetical protein
MKKTFLFNLLLLIAFAASSQNVKWAKGIGAANNDNVTGIAEDAAGNTYITGWYATSTTIGSNNFTSKGSNDIYIAKLDTAGTVVWAVSEGGTGDDRGYGVALDASGNVYICGIYSSNFTYGAGANAKAITSAGSTDIFGAKYSSTGTFQGISVAGGLATDRANAIAVDNNGNVIIVGFYSQPAGGGGGGGGQNGPAAFGNISLTNVGAGDAFVASANASGTWQWAKGFGSIRGVDASNDVAITPNGNNIYVTGTYRDTITLGNTTLISLTSTQDIFVASLDNSGNFVNAVSGGSSTGDAGNGVTLDTKGNVYACGIFAQAAGGGGGGGGGNTSFSLGSFTVTGTGQEGYIAAFSSNLTPQWVNSYGAANTDALNKISYGNGTLFLGGAYATSTTLGSVNLTSNGGADAFAASLDTAGTVLWAQTLGGANTEDCRRVLSTAGGNQYIVGTFNTSNQGGAGTGSFGGVTLSSTGGSDGYITHYFTCTGLSPIVTYSGPTNFCQSGSVLMTASSGATSYQWYFNGNAINNATQDTLTATAAGVYYCSMINAQGCQMNSSSTTINIGTAPTASFTTTGNSICSGDSMLLTANSGNGYKYKWYLNNTAITGFLTSTFYYAKQAGDYKVEVDNFGCTAMSSATTLSVISAPTLTIKANGATNICLGDSVILTGDTSSTWFYQWQRFSAGTWQLVNSNTDTYVAKAAGTFRLVITTTSGCNVSSNSIVITSGGITQATLQGIPGNGVLCYGDSVRLIINTGGGGGGGGQFQYRWMKDGDTIVGATTRNYTIKTSGTYKGVVISATCKAGTRDTTFTFINSGAGITPTGTANLCQNDTLNFTATGDPGSTFQWNLNAAAISGATNATYRASAAGSYNCIISLQGCNFNSAATVVTLYNNPTAPTVLQNVNNLASSLQAVGYQWYFNNAPIVGATSQFYYAYTTGFYMVEITDANGCKAKSPLFSFAYTANGINTLEINKLNLYPNPTTGTINFTILGEQKVQVSVYTIEGKEVLNNQYISNSGNQTLDISSLNNGMYIVKVSYGDRYFIDRVQVLKN